jgi:hypothetical protein
LCSALFSIEAASFGSSTMHRHRAVAALVAADPAEVAPRDVAALAAEHDPSLRLDDRVGEPFGIVGRAP